MKSFISNIKLYLSALEAYLAKNKPLLLLTKIHIIIPLLILLVIAALSVATKIPLYTTNTELLTLIPVYFLLFVYLLWLISQYSHRSPILTVKQMNLVFLINLISVFLLLITALSGRYVFDKRIKAAFKNHSISNVSDNVRIAMIRSGMIDSIKAGFYDSTNFNHVKYPAPNIYLDTPFENILTNKFLQYPVRGFITEMLADSTEDYFVKQDIATPYPQFINKIKAMPNLAITSVKQNISSTLHPFNLTSYDGGADSSNASVNTYYETLSKEVDQLYRNKADCFDYSKYLYVFFILLCSLSQVTILFLKNWKIIQLSMITYLAIILIAISFFWNLPTLHSYLSYAPFPLLLLTILLALPVFMSKERHFRTFLFFLALAYLLHTVVIALVFYLTEKLLFTYLPAFHAYWHTGFILLYLFIIIKTQRFFLKKFYIINCSPSAFAG